MRFHLTIRGRVQGVGYRYFVRSKAAQLKIAGWVRNCENGDVECEAQGPEEVLANFIGQLQEGPTSARVESVWRDQIPDQDDSKLFEIKY